MTLDYRSAPIKIDVLVAVAEAPNGECEMSRLINAALVDQEFCELLLTEPVTALVQGYNGETFDLALKDRLFILTTHASSLTDFARRWVRSGSP